jgi:excisionase family DNA binding protein
MNKSEWIEEAPAESKAGDIGLMLSPNPLWTVEDLAQFLRLKPETVRAMARRGDLPVMKIGRMWRFSSEEIRSWLNLWKQEIAE